MEEVFRALQDSLKVMPSVEQAIKAGRSALSVSIAKLPPEERVKLAKAQKDIEEKFCDFEKLKDKLKDADI